MPDVLLVLAFMSLSVMSASFCIVTTITRIRLENADSTGQKRNVMNKGREGFTWTWGFVPLTN